MKKLFRSRTDAIVQVLLNNGQPMSLQDLVDETLKIGWTPPEGGKEAQTPCRTIEVQMIHDLKRRFERVETGVFGLSKSIFPNWIKR
jgi:hypothetical protein